MKKIVTTTILLLLCLIIQTHAQKITGMVIDDAGTLLPLMKEMPKEV